MFYFEEENVKRIMLDGLMGLEKEGVRTFLDGRISKRAHPFDESWHLDKDYGESQLEFITKPYFSIKQMLHDMDNQTKKVNKFLSELEEPEMLWPFSVPPRIESEDDIIIAQFDGKEHYRTEYREYVTKVYGKYHLILSGVHVNYSFSDELMDNNYKLALQYGFDGSLRSYKDKVYLELAKKLLVYGHIITALTSASPVVDISYGDNDFANRLKEGKAYKKSGSSVFTGKGSLRCSELGYWNLFVPVLDYESIDKYAQSISEYIEKGMLKKCSELHYAYRIKPNGDYNLDSLMGSGAEYIELRMIDVNPYEQAGLSYEDALFIKLFLVWLMSIPEVDISEEFAQLAVRNHQRAAGYELEKEIITLPDGRDENLVSNCIKIIDDMMAWYSMEYNGSGELTMDDIEANLDYQKEKLLNPKTRYCHRIMEDYWPDYVKGVIGTL